MKKFLMMIFTIAIVCSASHAFSQEATIAERQAAWAQCIEDCESYLLEGPWAAFGKNAGDFTMTRYNYAVGFPIPRREDIDDVVDMAFVYTSNWPEESITEYAARMAGNISRDPWFMTNILTGNAPYQVVEPKDIDWGMYMTQFNPLRALVEQEWAYAEDFREATTMKLMSFTCKEAAFRQAYANRCSQVLSALFMYNMMYAWGQQYGYPPDPSMLVPTKAQIDELNAMLAELKPLTDEVNADISNLYLDRVKLMDDYMILWSMLWQCVDAASP